MTGPTTAAADLREPAGDRPPPTLPAPAPGSEWAVALTLGRGEMRRLFRTGLVRTALLLNLLLLLGAAPFPDLYIHSVDSAFVALPMAAFTLVASHRAVGRAGRDGTGELVDATSAPSRARTGGHLIAVGGPAVATATVIGAHTAFTAAGPNSYGSPDLLELATGPVLVLGAGALGVLLGRLASHLLVPIVACVAIAAAELYLVGDVFVGRGVRWLAFWVEAGTPFVDPDRPAAAHLAWVVGLAALAGLAALLRHGRTPTLTAVSLGVITVTLASAFAVTRPPSAADWAARDRAVADPSSAHRCSTVDGVEYCLFPAKTGLAPVALAPAVARLRAAVPERAWPAELAVAQWVSPADLVWAGSDIRRLADRMPALAAARTGASPDDGRVWIPHDWGWSRFDRLSYATAVASKVVGLPVTTGYAVCSAAGRSRAAVALYLASLAAGQERLRELEGMATGFGGRATQFVVGENEAAMGTAFGVEDARMAIALADRGRAEALDLLDTHWETLVAPSTTTASAATLLGLAGTYAVDTTNRPVFSLHPDVTVAGTCA